MDSFITLDLLSRWLHVVFGVTWIGLLYYFNFVQGSYFKEAEPAAKADATKKLAPRALWWFRWAAMFTFLTGLYLLHLVSSTNGIDGYILIGAVMGTIMFLNVWLVIWPAQKIVCGIVDGDAAAAAPKALLASRTNTLLSGPMLLGMLGSVHGTGDAGTVIFSTNVPGSMGLGVWIVLAMIIAIAANGLFGKLGPITTVTGVIHSSIGLTVLFLALLQFV